MQVSDYYDKTLLLMVLVMYAFHSVQVELTTCGDGSPSGPAG